MRSFLLAWSILYFSASPAAADVCISPADVLARVQKDIMPDAAGGSMTAQQTAAFAERTHFPFADQLGMFYVVATPAIVGVFVFDKHDCALGKDGTQAQNSDDPMVMILAPDQLRQIMAAINGSVIG